MQGNGFLATAAAAAATVALATSAAAQDRPTYELPAIEVTALGTDLHQRAMALYETPGRWAEAAELHARAAKALPRRDAARFWGFDRAARLYYYAGEYGSARKAMRDAAEIAVATGDVFTAAHAWVDAAFIAVAEGFPARVREYVKEARSIAASELLAADDRTAILARIDGTSGGPQAAAIALAARWGRAFSPKTAAGS